MCRFRSLLEDMRDSRRQSRSDSWCLHMWIWRNNRHQIHWHRDQLMFPHVVYIQHQLNRFPNHRCLRCKRCFGIEQCSGYLLNSNLCGMNQSTIDSKNKIRIHSETCEFSENSPGNEGRNPWASIRAGTMKRITRRDEWLRILNLAMTFKLSTSFGWNWIWFDCWWLWCWFQEVSWCDFEVREIKHTLLVIKREGIWYQKAVGSAAAADTYVVQQWMRNI